MKTIRIIFEGKVSKKTYEDLKRANKTSEWYQKQGKVGIGELFIVPQKPFKIIIEEKK